MSFFFKVTAVLGVETGRFPRQHHDRNASDKRLCNLLTHRVSSSFKSHAHLNLLKQQLSEIRIICGREEKNRRAVKISSSQNTKCTLPSQGQHRTEKTSLVNCQRTHHSGPGRATSREGLGGTTGGGVGGAQPTKTPRRPRPRHSGSGAQRPPGPRGLRTRPPKRPRESLAELPRRGGHLPRCRLQATHQDAGSSHGRRGRHSPPASDVLRISPPDLLSAAAPRPQTLARLAPPSATPRPQRK